MLLGLQFSVQRSRAWSLHRLSLSKLSWYSSTQVLKRAKVITIIFHNLRRLIWTCGCSIITDRFTIGILVYHLCKNAYWWKYLCVMYLYKCIWKCEQLLGYSIPNLKLYASALALVKCWMMLSLAEELEKASCRWWDLRQALKNKT